jgi:hypothetical protein
LLSPVLFVSLSFSCSPPCFFFFFFFFIRQFLSRALSSYLAL